MKKNLKTILFIAVLSLYSVSFFAQTDKPLNELSLKELEKEAKNNPDALVMLGDINRIEANNLCDEYNKMELHTNQISDNFDSKANRLCLNALKYYTKAAKQNNSKGQYGIAKMEDLLGNVSRKLINWYKMKYNNSFDWFKLAADQNLAEAQYELGNIYKIGGKMNYYSMNKDFNKAIELYQKAADQNLPEAQYELAMIYGYGGNGIIQDNDKYNLYIFKAANNNYYKAQNQLSEAYIRTKNFNEALKWAQKGYDNTPTSAYNNENEHSYTLDIAKKAVYEDSRNKSATKQGSEGIAKLAETRKKENDDYWKTVKEKEERLKEEVAEYHAKASKEKAEREAETEKKEQAFKWAQADQQRSFDKMNKESDQRLREMNAMNNPTSIDAINLAAENRAKNAAFYESVDRNKNTEEENSSSNSNSRTASNTKPSSNTNSSETPETKLYKRYQSISEVVRGRGITKDAACEQAKKEFEKKKIDLVSGAEKFKKKEGIKNSSENEFLNISECKCQDLTAWNSKTKDYMCEIYFRWKSSYLSTEKETSNNKKNDNTPSKVIAK